MHLFCAAYGAAVDPPSCVTVADAREYAGEVGEMIETFQKAAEFLDQLGEERLAAELNRIVSMHEYDDDVWWESPYLVRRDRGNSDIRAYAVALSTMTYILFGKALYGTLATIVNVVFDRKDVNASKIHEMLRRIPFPWG